MPSLKTIFNRSGKHKNRMAVIAYMMATVLFILSPDYIYGASNYDMQFVGSTITKTEVIEEETANEAIVRTDIVERLTKETTNSNPFILLNLTDNYQEYKKPFTKGLMLDNTLESTSENTEANSKKGAAAKVDSSSTDKSTKKDKSKKQTKEMNTKNIESNKAGEAAKETQAAAKAKTVVNLSVEDQEVLQRIVEAEATGEDIKGRILVANVILNRVNSKTFPDTVKGVVFQKTGSTYQFSPIKDQRYWSVTISKKTITAVEKVMDGEDYSKGALYFSARSKAEKKSMSWFDNNLEFLFKYGGHEFFR
jgi:N-acetylmuramoyl-L-alanine amidase